MHRLCWLVDLLLVQQLFVLALLVALNRIDSSFDCIRHPRCGNRFATVKYDRTSSGTCLTVFRCASIKKCFWRQRQQRKNKEISIELAKDIMWGDEQVSRDQLLIKATIDSKRLIKTLFVNCKELLASLYCMQSVLKQNSTNRFGWRFRKRFWVWKVAWFPPSRLRPLPIGNLATSRPRYPDRKTKRFGAWRNFQCCHWTHPWRNRRYLRHSSQGIQGRTVTVHDLGATNTTIQQ